MDRIWLALFLTATAVLAQDTRVILLGTGTPNADPERMGPAVAVVSGDRVYIVDCGPALVAAAKGCDILVHEVYSKKGLTRRSPVWQRYHAAFHTSGPDVGRIAALVRPSKLVLYHILTMGETPEQVLREVRRNFAGEIVFGKDLEVIR